MAKLVNPFQMTAIASVTALISATLSAPVAAATLSPAQQVQQATDWFTGLFNNRAQVSQDPSVPFIAMENCAIAASNGMANSNYVHLEQYIGGPATLLRSSAYEFSPTERGVNIGVFSYLDRTSALGTCDEASPTIDFANLAFPSCDVPLDYKPNQFVGSNAPTGCPTGCPVPGSTVVSSLTLTENSIDSLDTFLLPTGGSVGTLIEFRPVSNDQGGVSTPEPVATLSLALLGIWLVLARRQRDLAQN